MNGLPAQMQNLPWGQRIALGLKSITKFLKGADFGICFFLGVNWQLLYAMRGIPLKEIPLKEWEMYLVIFLDIMLGLAVLALLALISVIYGAVDSPLYLFKEAAGTIIEKLINKLR